MNAFSNLDTINLLVALAGVANLIYGLIVYQRRKESTSNYTFLTFAISVALWSFAMVAFRATHTVEAATSAVRILYVIAALIPLAFVAFALTFESNRKYRPLLYAALTIPTIVMAILAALPTGLIQSVRIIPGSETVIVFNQLLHGVYLVYVAVYAFSVIVLIYNRHRVSTGTSRSRLAYILIGTSVPWVIGMTTNLFLPFIHVFGLNWVGQVSTFFSTTIITYGIFRSRLFDVRIVATELLTFGLCAIIFVEILISETFAIALLQTSVFILLVIFGRLLIRSINREIEQREEIERLSNEKSEFMTFASHEIRNPITAMRGYASLIVDGTVDHASPEVRAVARKILVEGNDVLNLISQYLNKSKLELGQITYDMAPFDIGSAVAVIAEGHKPHAEQKGLTLTVDIDPTEQFTVTADEGKVKEVVGNLIDNSIKYTKEGGITLFLQRVDGKVRVVVSDTGVGIPAETLPKLFQKFSRADATKANLLGTGVGLYLAKMFIEAMGGRVWAESGGQGKGSKFIVELSAARAGG